MATPTIREVLHGTGVNANVTLTTGVGTQVGDVLVAVHGGDYYTAADLVAPSTGPAWTLAAGGSGSALGDLGNLNSHVKIFTATVASAGAIAITFPKLLDADHMCVLYVLAGADPNGPVDDAAGSSGGPSVSHLAPSLSPASPDALYIGAVVSQLFALVGTYTCPVLTKQTEDDQSSTMATGTQALSASGATGTRTFSADINVSYASAAVAIRAPQSADATLAVTAAAATLAMTGGPLVAPDLDVMVGPPESGWVVGDPDSSWALGVPESGWMAGAPE